MKNIFILAEVDEDAIREMFDDEETSIEQLVMDALDGSFWDDLQSRYIRTRTVISQDAVISKDGFAASEGKFI